MKILIVDDDEYSLETLQVFLETEGWEVLTAKTGEEGIKKAVVSDVGLVMLDIKLPDMNGIAVLERLVKINKNLPVIMITAYKDAEKVIDAFRSGAVDCVLKPFNFDYIKTNVLPRVKKL